MPPHSAVADYLDTLSRALSFDHALAARVRREAEDHLHEAAAAEPDTDVAEAQRNAIAAFGDPSEVARQYAALSLFRQTRRASVILILALAGIFIMMKSRGAWYHAVQWDLAEQSKWLASIVLSIDFNAFRVALAAGVAGLVYVALGQMPVAWHQACRTQMRRRSALLAIAAAALLVSVIADVVSTVIHLFRTASTASPALPIVSTAAELIIGALLACDVIATRRRIARVSYLLPP